MKGKAIKFFLFIIMINSFSCKKEFIKESSQQLLEKADNKELETEIYSPKKYKTKSCILWKNDSTELVFGENHFVLSKKNENGIETYDFNNVNPLLVNGTYEIPIELSIYCEVIDITEITDTTYWFDFLTLDQEELKILDLNTMSFSDPFFDMKNDIHITCIDYDNKVMFGNSWNSDKDFSEDQEISLYLFSTAKQMHYKVVTLKGKIPFPKITDWHTIQYEDEKGEIISFDYSDWI